MKYNIISYFLREGINNVFKNRKSTLSCLGVMCATMLIFGLFFSIGKNINNSVKKLEAEQTVNVFILNGTTDQEIEELRKKIDNIKVNDIKAVNTITYRTKQDAYNTARKLLKDKAFVMDGRDPEMFSDSFSITLTDLKFSDEVQKQIEQMEHVKNIVSKNDLIQNLSKVADWIRNITIAILTILIVISIFIISNTIKLTVHARRKEISIMKYVGATDGFIRAPFIIEGIVIGLIAGIISILLVGGGYNLIANKVIQNKTIQTIGFEILSFNDIAMQVTLVYLILGIGIGVIGSLISMKKYLEV